MRRLRALPAVALAWLLAAALLPGQEIDFPLIQALAWIPPQQHGGVPPAAAAETWEITAADANIYSFTQGLESVNDLSLASFTACWRRRLSPRLALEVSWSLRRHYASSFDQVIQKVDRALGFADSGRDLFPWEGVHFWYKDRFAVVSEQWTAMPLVIGLAFPLKRIGAFTVGGRLALGLPLADRPGISSGKPYLLAGASGEYAGEKVRLYGAVTAAAYKRPGWLLPGDARSSYLLGELRAQLSRWSLGVLLRGSPLDFAEMANPGKMIYIGYRVLRGWRSA